MADERIFIEPNWRSPVTVSFEFKTDVFASREGYETRSSLREFPRVQTSFSLLGGRDSDIGWKGLVAANLAKKIDFPDLTRMVRAEALGANYIQGDFALHVFTYGSVVFVEKGGVYYSVTVESNTGTVLQVSAGATIAAGDDVSVMPAMKGRVAQDMSARHRTGRVFETDLTFEAYAVQDRVQSLLDWEPSQWYRERPVVLWAPNWLERVQETWARDEFAMDVGYGIPWFEAKRKSPSRSVSYKALLHSKDDAHEVMSMFCYCRGRQASFYAPTWVEDFRFTQAVVEGQTTIRVKGHGPMHLFENTDTYRNIAVRSAGEFFLTGIQDIYVTGVDCEVVLNEPIPAEFSGAKSASWLLRQRFASDKIELEYRTDSVAEVDVKMVSVIEDFEVIKLSGAELTIGGHYVTLGAERDIETYTLSTFGGYSVTVGGDFLA